MNRRESVSTRPPDSITAVLRYANARPTNESWRQIVVAPFTKFYPALRYEAAEGSPLGVESLDFLKRALADLRGILSQIVELKHPASDSADTIVRRLNQKARPQLRQFRLGVKSKRLFPEWETKHQNFEELLYFCIVQALTEVPYTALHQCHHCGRFFYGATARRVKYCSPRCRNYVLLRRYRQRHPERYRRYQRLLMRRLRRGTHQLES